MGRVNDKTIEEFSFDPKKGVRGKYFDAYRKGYSIRIHSKDGELEEQYFASIESDVHEHYPNSESINKALRSLIQKERV